MWKSGTVALLTVVVVGCATPAQVQAPEQRQKHIAADQERTAEHLQRDLGPVCTSAGLTPGTDAHSRCMDSLYRLELERRAANRVLPK
jgi:hypothetical protein